MEKRQIGKSQLLASKIGLGCMSLNLEEKSTYLVHKAIELGINYFDTADLYDFGENEVLLGKSLKGRRHDVIIATKVGNEWNSVKNGWTWNPTKAYIKETVKQSLHRLQTDYIDLYQLHGGTIEDPIEETIEAFEELIQEGWIRYYGISSIRPNVIKEYVKNSNISSVMMQYSLLDRRPEEEIMSLLNENQISLIARGPVAKGLLTEDFSQKLSNEGYLDYSMDELKLLLPKLKYLAHDHQYELQQLALHYCLGNVPTATVVPGARTIEQLEQNVAAIHVPPLSIDIKNSLNQLLKQNVYSSHR